MKTFDPNNMVIDHVFKKLDKKRKRKEKKLNKETKTVSESKSLSSNTDGYYTININL